MKVLVTGGAGFIGSHLAEGLLAAGHKVVVVDNLTTGSRQNIPSHSIFYKLDIRSARLRDVFKSESPDVVCHHAAQMSVLVSLRDPGMDASNNILGGLNVLACAQEMGVPQFIFASSGGTVYGEPQTSPVPEETPLLPLSPYGISKMSFEHYLRIAHHTTGLNYTSLRYANVYGPRQSPHGEAGVVAIFAEKMLKGESTTIFGDGNQTRDFIYVEDVVQANLAAIEHQPQGAINIGTGVGTSVNTIHALLGQLTHYTGVVDHQPPKTGEVYQIVLDCHRAQDLLHWQAITSLEQGLSQTVASYA